MIHIVTMATFYGFALLGGLINYGRSHAKFLQRNRENINYLETRLSELEASMTKLPAQLVSSFPQPSSPSSSECAFDMVDDVCTSKGKLHVIGDFSASQGGNDTEDQPTKSDIGAPYLRMKGRWLT